MNETIVQVKGVHCEACTKIIEMSIEDDPDLKELFKKIELVDLGETIGEITFSQLSEENREKLEELLTSVGDYEIYGARNA